MTRPMTRSLLLACTGLMALAGAAEADTVRVTIAEYSKGTGPYFEEAAAAFEKANPGIDIQIEVAPWGCSLPKAPLFADRKIPRLSFANPSSRARNTPAVNSAQ